jgi:two-component system CheB/CheR fusion protein
MTLARENVCGTARTVLHRAQTQNEPVSLRDGLVETDGVRTRLEITAAPLERETDAQYFLISFIEHPEPIPQPSVTNQSDPDVQEELRRVRDELQSTIEELQTANEEMKASSEETMSINEELQSTNEEIETSKEELQSLNEELTTVNVQLHAKMDELERTTNDLASLLSSTDIAVLFLDTRYRIRRFTPAVRDLIDLIPSDIGRPLNDLARKFVDADLLADAQLVLGRLVPIEKEITSKAGRWYVRRVLPYRTADNRIDGIVITFVDVTELHRAQLSERDLEQRQTWSVQALGIGDWEIELPAQNIHCSPRGRELLGITTSAPIELSTVLRKVHPDDRANLQQAFDAALALDGDKRFAAEFRIVRPDGGVTWIETLGAVSFAPTPAGPAPNRLRAILVEATNRKIAENALREAKTNAEAANDAKDQFIATVSHELRTPLSAILLWTRMLKTENPDAPEKLTEGFDAIMHSAETQQHLIEDLIDSARIATGKFALEFKDVELATDVASIIETAQPAARERSITLNADLGSDIGTVRVDPNRIEQVLNNLLSNALKFTPPHGQINVAMKRLSDGEIEIRISDTGQGIDPAFLPHIFNRFRQAEATPTRSKGGLGLGLAIARQIIELHRGRITAASDGLGHGTTFTITLPLPAITTPTATPPSEDLVSNALTGAFVLLLEDDPATRKAVMMLLNQAGATVIPASTAREALALLAQRRPDLILSDIGLPDEDGFVFIRRVRTMEAATGVSLTPAVALTAYAQDQDRRKATASGFQHHLAKPVNPTQLIQTLHHLHHQH